MNVTETTPPTARKFTLEVDEKELHVLHSLVGATYPSLFDSVDNVVLGDMYDGMQEALGVTHARYSLSVSKWTNKR